MGAIFASVIEFIGNIISTAGSVGCYFLFFDEPEMPKHLIEK